MDGEAIGILAMMGLWGLVLWIQYTWKDKTKPANRTPRKS